MTKKDYLSNKSENSKIPHVTIKGLVNLYDWIASYGNYFTKFDVACLFLALKLQITVTSKEKKCGFKQVRNRSSSFSTSEVTKQKRLTVFTHPRFKCRECFYTKITLLTISVAIILHYNTAYTQVEKNLLTSWNRLYEQADIRMRLHGV